jgi:hypothetical protein
MADLNALIAQGVQFQAPPDPFAQYAQMQQLQQGAQANQLNQMKMQEYQRGVQEQNALRQLYSKPGVDISSPEFGQAIAAISPSAYQSHLKAVQESQKSAADIALAKAKTGEAEQSIAKSQRGFVRDSLTNLSLNPSDANITAWTEDAVLLKHLTPEKADAKRQELLSMALPERKAYLAQQGLSSADTAKLFESKPVEKTDGKTKWTEEGNPRLPTFGQHMAGTNAITMQPTPGESLTASTARRGQDITARGQDLTNARELQSIAIRQEDQRRAADPAFQQQMAGAKQLGQDMAKNQVLRETQLPKVLDTANQTLAEIDALIGKRDKTGKLLEGQRPHPGFSNAVGAGFPLRFIPGTSESDFQTRFDQVKGGAFLQAFETLKGGGSITNVEGDKGTAALNRMNLAQSEKEFVQAARDFQDVIRVGVERAKKMAGKPTATPTGGAPAAAAPTVSNW